MQKLTIHNVTPEWTRAAARAAEHYAAGSRAVALNDRDYAIRSSREPVTYTVHVESVSRLDCTCNCPAGSHGRVCYHQALAIEAAAERIRQYAKAAPVAPERTAEQVAATQRLMDRFRAA